MKHRGPKPIRSKVMNDKKGEIVIEPQQRLLALMYALNRADEIAMELDEEGEVQQALTDALEWTLRSYINGFGDPVTLH